MNRRLPAILLLALLAIFSVSTWLVPGKKDLREHGTRSSTDSGRRGLLRLLSEFDFDAQRWEKRPGALPVRPGMVWLARLPAGAEVASEESSAEPQAEARGATPLREALLQGLSNPEHYRRFAVQGGNVLVEISDAKELTALAADFGFFEIEHLALAPAPEKDAGVNARLESRWIGGEPLELSASEAASFTGLESIPGVHVLLEDSVQAPLIVEVPIGRGNLVLASCGAIFDNGEVSLHDHAVVAVRLAERESQGASIWIDESSGLGGNTPTLLELAVEPRSLPFTVSLCMLALLFVWRSFFAREIPRDPPPLEFMSPRTRALARARLFQRARRFDLLADQLRRGIVRRIGEGARVPPAVCAEALSGLEPARRFAQAIGASAEQEKWLDALVKKPVLGARGLTQLDSDLRALEDQLQARVQRAPRRRIGRKTTLTTK